MEHRFKNTCYDAQALLSGCLTLRKFMNNVVKQSKLHPSRWEPMTYRGDAFEALVEVLIKASPIDKRINIINYRPWNTSQDGPDVGVDGLGLSHNGKPHTIQVKFRSKASEQLTANKDHISNFVAKSDTMYHTDQDMTIFTTASALMETVNNEMYGGRVRTIGFKEISKLIDKNESFWSIFRHEMNVV